MKSVRTGWVRAASVAALVLGLAGAAYAEDPVGKWTGFLASPRGPMEVRVTISKNAGGELKAVIESPAQEPGKTVPLALVEAERDYLTLVLSPTPKASQETGKPRGFVFEPDTVFTLPRIRSAHYTGKWDAGKQMWIGTWKQDGREMKLDFERVS